MLYSSFKEFIRDRDMYYICANILKPVTRKRKISYAEFVGPRTVKWFVSHYWGTPFRHFLDSIISHAEAIEPQNWADEAYWICSLSNNQWKIPEELGQCDMTSGGKSFEQSSFYKSLTYYTTRGTVMVLDAQALPLSRSWCLFELAQTFELQSRANFAGLFLCTSTGVMNFGGASIDTAIAIARKLSQMRLEDADASDAKDKEMIDAMVEQMGGFDKMNNFIRQQMYTSIRNVQKVMEEEFSELCQELVFHPVADRHVCDANEPCGKLGDICRVSSLRKERRRLTVLAGIIAQTPSPGSSPVAGPGIDPPPGDAVDFRLNPGVQRRPYAATAEAPGSTPATPLQAALPAARNTPFDAAAPSSPSSGNQPPEAQGYEISPRWRKMHGCSPTSPTALGERIGGTSPPPSLLNFEDRWRTVQVLAATLDEHMQQNLSDAMSNGTPSPGTRSHVSLSLTPRRVASHNAARGSHPSGARPSSPASALHEDAWDRAQALAARVDDGLASGDSRTAHRLNSDNFVELCDLRRRDLPSHCNSHGA